MTTQFAQNVLSLRQTQTVNEDCIHFSWYDLSRSSDSNAFERLQSQALQVLQRSYGDAGHTPEVHLNRLWKEEHRILVARAGTQRDPLVVGCSYVRVDGKRGATAVDPLHQARGIGNLLVAESVSFIPTQIAEVQISNIVQRTTLARNGFVTVCDSDELWIRLGILASLVQTITRIDNYLTYTRSSWDRPEKSARYVMYRRH